MTVVNDVLMNDSPSDISLILSSFVNYLQMYQTIWMHKGGVLRLSNLIFSIERLTYIKLVPPHY